MYFRNSCPRRSTYRPRRRDSRRSRSRNWSPSQVENAVNGAAGLATLRSESIPGLSVVTITFADGVDVHVARQGISERLSELGDALPAGVGTPKLSPLVSSTMDLLKIGLVSDKVDAYTLRDTADWVIKPRLLAVPGVAHVIVFGGDVRQIQILPDTRKLASFGITLNGHRRRRPCRAAAARRRIHRSRRAARADAVADPGAGYRCHRSGGGRGAQRHPHPLRDVAEVKIAPALRFGDALIMGKPGVLLSLASQYGANTLTTTLAVEQALARFGARAQGAGHHALHEPASAGQFHRARARRISRNRCSSPRC